MANVLAELFQNTANAIREKTGNVGTMKPAEFPDYIRGIGTSPNIVPLTVTTNDTYTAGEGVDGYSPIIVKVPIPNGYIKPEGTLVISENGIVDVSQYASVEVEVPIPDDYIKPEGTLAISENGIVDVSQYASVEVNVESGGGSADVVNVTFIGADGSVLDVKPCIKGDDCYDPVITGRIPTPTKESTVQYTYTHSGWSLTDGGEKDSSALSNVTADRTVYAVFKANTRIYTITFYDEDGTTVLNTQQVAYGSIPSYTPSARDGYNFDGWNPSISAVTGDTSYIAKWVPKATFETATWAQIGEICDSGNAPTTFKIGDTKPVTLTYTDGTSETIRFRIVDMNADSTLDGTPVPLTLIAENLVKKSVIPGSYSDQKEFLGRMNNYSTFLESIYAAMPSDLQAVIKGVKKDKVEGISSADAPTYLFTPSAYQLNATQFSAFASYAELTPKKPYAYFASGNSRARNKVGDESANTYWVNTATYRSGTLTYTYSYNVFGINGNQVSASYDTRISSASHGVLVGFCI